jgi:hypothetical protein
MKSIIRTSVMVLAVAGMLALSASQALAAPEPLGPENGGPMVQMGVHSVQLPDEEYPVEPDALNEGLNELPCELCQDDNAMPNEPDETVVPDEPVTHGVPGTPGTTNIPKRQPAPPETPESPGTRLPNTGSHLLILAVLGISLATVAMAARRIAFRCER